MVRMLRDESGQGLVEYGGITAIMSQVIDAFASVFSKLADLFSHLARLIH